MEVPEENEIGHFWIKLGQSREVSRGMAVTIFHSFSESLNKWRHVGQWTGCQNGKANFGGSDPTVQRQVTLEEVPNILVGMNQNRPVLLTSHRNFQNLWQNGKYPKGPFLCSRIHEPTLSVSYPGWVNFSLISFQNSTKHLHEDREPVSGPRQLGWASCLSAACSVALAGENFS